MAMMMTDKAASSSESNQSRSLPTFGTCKPSWLLSTIADLEERMKVLSPSSKEGDDTFAERAESYYRKRPELLSLLYDLHNAYLALADRYTQTLAKNHHHHRRSSSQLSTITVDHDGAATAEIGCVDSDAESSLSYQPSTPRCSHRIDGDAVIAELVMKCVEYDIVVEEIGESERRYGESGRKIELQRSLLEVLEAERLILLSENASLVYRAEALADENEAMAAEVVALKRKAGELARCALRMREDHRVCLLGRKIEDLQSQVRGLEIRNREYCDMLVKRSDSQQRKRKKKKNKNGYAVVDLDLLCCQAEKPKATKQKREDGLNDGGRRAAKWWTSFRKNLDLFQCLPRSEFP